MANPYLERMEQLDSKRVSNNYRQLSEMAGLPINKPGSNQPTASPSGVPTGGNPKPSEDEAYKNSTFFYNFEQHRKDDEHFGSFTDELSKLATGLRQQVERGYMPQPIAEDNIRQFINDTMKRREIADPHIQRQQAQKAAGQFLQQLASRAVQEPTEDSPMAQAAAQQAQQAQDNPPAIQNLSEQGDMANG